MIQHTTNHNMAHFNNKSKNNDFFDLGNYMKN